MNDEPPEILVAGKKRFSDPEEVTRALLIEGTIGMCTSMNKEPLTIIVGEMQRTDPV
jgi:hypothetical protein